MKRVSPQKIRFLIAGAFNTVSSIVLFTCLYYLLADFLHYIFIALLAYLLSITNSFLVFRYFVFMSNGPFLQEYFKSFLVYGVALTMNMFLLILLVEFLNIHPVIAQILTAVITVVFSYIGSSRFTFKKNDNQ
jgi:putative flippase GtrA